MALIKRANVPKPMAPRETVTVAALGGDVVVRGQGLATRLELSSIVAKAQAAGDAAGGEIAAARGTAAVVFASLADAVVDADDEPVFDAAQWAAFDRQHPGEVDRLYQVARRLSGLDEETNEGN